MTAYAITEHTIAVGFAYVIGSVILTWIILGVGQLIVSDFYWRYRQLKRWRKRRMLGLNPGVGRHAHRRAPQSRK